MGKRKRRLTRRNVLAKRGSGQLGPLFALPGTTFWWSGHTTHVNAIRTLEHPPTSNREIDVLARDIATRTLAGEVAEKDARWKLASFVYRSNIPESVVGRATAGRQMPQQVVTDSIDFVREQLTKMIVGPNSKLDLEIVAKGSSLCGWASRIIAGPYVFPKTNFDSRTRRTRVVTVSDDTISSLVALRTIGEYGISSMFDEEVERRHDIVDEYMLLAKGLREWELVHLNAEHICTVSSVAPPRRAANATNRRALLAKLESSDVACRDDLRVADTSRDSLASLFTNLTSEEMDKVASLAPLSSQMLARSALTPVPPPRQTVMKTLRTNVTASVGGQRSALDLCRAYVNVVSEIDGSEFAPASERRQIKRSSVRKADFANWNEISSGLVERGFVALGETPDQILTSLSRHVRAISLDRAGRAPQRLSA